MVRNQNKIPVGYLWEKTDRNGNKYLGGVISLGVFGEIPIVVFKNTTKNDGEDKTADWTIRSAPEDHA